MVVLLSSAAKRPLPRAMSAAIVVPSSVMSSLVCIDKLLAFAAVANRQPETPAEALCAPGFGKPPKLRYRR